MGDECAIKIIKSLEKNNSLMSLIISNNSITCVCAIEIAQMLTLNNSLKSLDISNNSLNILGLNAIIDSLENNFALTELDITVEWDIIIDETTEQSVTNTINNYLSRNRDNHHIKRFIKTKPCYQQES